MGTINFSFLPGNKSRPKTKCNLTFIPSFFSSINFFIPYGNIFLKKNTDDDDDLLLTFYDNNSVMVLTISLPYACYNYTVIGDGE